MIHVLNDHIAIPDLGLLSDEIILFDHNRPHNFHYSTSFTFKYLFTGKLTYHINNQPVNLQAGSFILIRADQLIHTSIRTPVKGVSLFFKEDFSSYLDEGLMEFPLPLIHSELISCLNQLNRKEHPPTSPFISQLIQHVFNYSRKIQDWRTSMGYSKPSTSLDVLRKLLAARMIMETRYSEPLSLQQISDQIAMSKFNFVRKFRKTFGITPQKYLVEKRIEESKHQLLNMDSSITEVASICGFQNIHHFSKTFKKHLGIAPSGYKLQKCA
jgi:AraC-like DNA-binding protein